MVQPLNFITPAADPLGQFAKSFNIGSAVRNQGIEAEKREQEIQVQKTQQEAIRKLSQPGVTFEDYANAANVLPPEHAKSIRDTFALKTDVETQSALKQGGEVLAAFRAGKPDIAIQSIERQAEARRNSGDEEGAKFLDLWANVAKENPTAAEAFFGTTLAAIPGSKEIIESAIKLRKEPAALREAGSKADKAAIEAKFAESQAVIDIQKKGFDIKKIQNDIKISKENARIAAMQAAEAKATTDLKREELQQKIATAQANRDVVVNERVAELEGARFNIDNMLNTVDRAVQTDSDVIDSATGPISSRTPTLSQDTADFEELINTIDAQAFLSQIPQLKGLGALSDAEGLKVSRALQSLSLRQSAPRLVENLREVQRLMLKARKFLADKHGVPETTPDTPAAEPTPEDINALVDKFGPGGF